MKKSLLKDSPEYENYSENYKRECSCKKCKDVNNSKIILVKDKK